MNIPEKPEQPPVPGTPGGSTPSGEGTSVASAEAKKWFEETLEKATSGPLSPEEKDKLVEKLKHADRFVSQSQRELDRERRELAGQKDEVRQLMEELKGVKSSKDVNAAFRGTSGEVRDLLEEAIERTDDPSSRETLRWLDKMLTQRLGKIGDLEKTITELRQSLAQDKQVTQASRLNTLSADVNDLAKRYGDGVEQYRDAIISNCLQHPTYSARKMLQMVMPEDSYDQMIEVASRQKAKTPAPNGAKASPTSTSPANASDEFRGKTPKEIGKGFNKAFDKAFEAVKGRMPGL